jgi:hypothetical protein
MNDSPVRTSELDEQVWREWVHKGKVREQSRARRRRKVMGILFALASIAIVVIYVSARP